jgi:hypothetical protein
MKRILSLGIAVALLITTPAVNAQSPGITTARSADYWLRYTAKLPIGATVRVRTADGKRMTAVLAIVDETGITVEPKTRVPESPRHIAFDQLAQVELKENHSNAAKSAAIGVATGAGTFFGILLILAAVAYD